MATRLRLLHGEELGRGLDPVRIPSLAAQPFRPGELPDVVQVDFPPNLAQLAQQKAAAAGIPTELWIRIAAEAERHLRTAADLLDLSGSQVADHLDAVASEPLGALAPVSAHRQRAYAKLLRSGQAGPTPPPRNRFTLRLPDQMLAAWTLLASRNSKSTSDFVADLLPTAPRHAVRWEAASAEGGQQLGEWIYMQSLRIKAR